MFIEICVEGGMFSLFESGRACNPGKGDTVAFEATHKKGYNAAWTTCYLPFEPNNNTLRKLSTFMRNYVSVTWPPSQLRGHINQTLVTESSEVASHQPSSLQSLKGAEMTCPHQALLKLQAYEQNKYDSFKP